MPAIVSKMVGSEESWGTMISFCEDVLLQKEAVERKRERFPISPIPSKKGQKDDNLHVVSFHKQKLHALLLLEPRVDDARALSTYCTEFHQKRDVVA